MNTPALAWEQRMQISESIILCRLEVMTKQSLVMWSLYTGCNYIGIGTQNMVVSGRVRQVVFIYRFNNMEKI